MLRCCTSVHLCWRGEINEHQGIQILSCLSSYVHIIPAVILRPIQPAPRKSSGEKRKIDKDEVDIMSVPMGPSKFTASGSKVALLPILCLETAALQKEIVSPLKCLPCSFQFIYYIVFTI